MNSWVNIVFDKKTPEWLDMCERALMEIQLRCLEDIMIECNKDKEGLYHLLKVQIAQLQRELGHEG